MRKPIFMAKSIALCILIIFAHFAKAQNITTNRNVVGMEHNLLFSADTRFQVSITGYAKVEAKRMFDGIFIPSYSGAAATNEDPTVILIENLPSYHVQRGAWVGWSTRWWPAIRFKIEAYNVYSGMNSWVTVADYSQTNYSGYDFNVKMPSGAYSKLRFTFYSASGDNGRLGISELFFLHPEATPPYYGLAHSWERTEDNLYRRLGNVGIGITAPAAKLHVDGNIIAKEIKVEAQTADFVFEDDYQLKSLEEVEQFITTNKHLPDIPSAKQMEKDGVGLAEMNKLLLQKVEELTLYVIEQQKEIVRLKTKEEKINQLEEKIQGLINQKNIHK